MTSHYAGSVRHLQWPLVDLSRFIDKDVSVGSSAVDDEGNESSGVLWTLTREVGGRGTFRRLEVVVDDERVAQLATGESVQLHLSPGPHRLRVRTGFSASDERTIDGKSGERYEARFSLPHLWGAIAARTPWPTKAWTIDVYRLHAPA